MKTKTEKDSQKAIGPTAGKGDKGLMALQIARYSAAFQEEDAFDEVMGDERCFSFKTFDANQLVNVLV